MSERQIWMRFVPKIVAGVTILILLSTLLVDASWEMGLWFNELFEWLHVPVFGLIAFLILTLLPSRWPTPRRFGLTFLISMALAVTSEAAQIPLSRDASVSDVVNDAYGVASFLLFAMAQRRTTLSSLVLVIAALGILVWSLLPLGSISQAVLLRNAQFPIIYGGDFEAERRLVTLKNLSVSTGPPSSTDSQYTRIVIPASRNSAIEFHDLKSDWSEYSHLRLILQVEGNDELNLMLRIHDKAHTIGNQPSSDRFTQSLFLPPGFHSVRIPLEDVRQAPRSRVMEMREIDKIIIFANPQDSQRAFRLLQIRLD